MTITSGRSGLSIGERISDPDGYSLENKLTFIEFHNSSTGFFLLLQTGDYLLLQSGGKILLEAA